MSTKKEEKKEIILRTNPLDWGFPYWSTLFGITSAPLFDVWTWIWMLMNLPEFLPCETCRLESSSFLYDNRDRLVQLKTVKDCQGFLIELRDFVTKNIVRTQTNTQEDVFEYVLRDDGLENQKTDKFLKRAHKFPFFWRLDVHVFLVSSILAAGLRGIRGQDIAQWVLDVVHLVPFKLFSQPTLNQFHLFSKSTDSTNQTFMTWVQDSFLSIENEQNQRNPHFLCLDCPLPVLLRRIVAPICPFYDFRIVS
jgi:hypothetical protein